MLQNASLLRDCSKFRDETEEINGEARNKLFRDYTDIIHVKLNLP